MPFASLRIAALSGALAGLAALTAAAPVRAQDAAATDSPCRAEMAACWFIVFGTGDAPQRRLYVANARTRSLPDGAVSIEGIEMFETPDKYNYVASTFDFDCAKKQLRIPRAYAQKVDGKIERAPPRDQSWTPVQEYSWVGQVFKLACMPDAQTTPKKYAFLWFSDLARAADALPLARRVLWEREFQGDGKRRRR